MVAESLARPYKVPPSMLLLFSLIPLYIFIPAVFPPPARFAPELPLDRALPLIPSWALVYGALYLFLILLPILVVRQDALIRRTVHAYLLVWISAYAFFFVLYPTQAPRPEVVPVEGFGAWGLRALYSSDPPYNCFPSLHVAHSFVSAFSSHRVHGRLGIVAITCAFLVAVSTLVTRQHYILDAIAGIGLAILAWLIFLRGYPASAVPESDRRVAPALALCAAGLVLAVLVISWLAYRWTIET